MKYRSFVVVFLVGAFIVNTMDASAQRRTRRRTGNQQNTQQNNQPAEPNPYLSNQPGNPSDTTKKNTNTAGSNTPIKFVPSQGNPLTDTIKPSLRNEDAIERNLVKDRAPLEYENLREDDAVYMQKVWRVIDTREKLNLSFRNPSVEDDGSQMFLSILYKAVTDPENPITAFKDERFSEFYTPDDFQKKFSGGIDTVGVVDINTGEVTSREARQRGFAVDSVYQFELKEEWIFDKESSRMFVRIIGIAPMMKLYSSDGRPLSDEPYPMFWIYYPDIRSLLAKREVYNGKNFGARMTWEELFEGRMFSSRIVKSTLDNPYDMPFAAYIKDPLFRLLEGEKVKDKIFDYEQSLWSY